MDYAILDADNNCINRILWDGESPWQPPEACTAVADPDSLYPIYTEPQPKTEAKADLLASLTDEQKAALVALLK